MFYKFTYNQGDEFIYGTFEFSNNKVDWTFSGKMHFPLDQWIDLMKRFRAGGIILEAGQPKHWGTDPDPLNPQWCESQDPDTAKEAAQSEEAKVALSRGIARCYRTLHEVNQSGKYKPYFGLTNHEIVEEYVKRFPEQVDHNGIAKLVPSIRRDWDYLKVNRPRSTTVLQNLCLVVRTDFKRMNSTSDKMNIVFNFLHPPTKDELKEMYDWSEKPDPVRKSKIKRLM